MSVNLPGTVKDTKGRAVPSGRLEQAEMIIVVTSVMIIGLGGRNHSRPRARAQLKVFPTIKARGWSLAVFG